MKRETRPLKIQGKKHSMHPLSGLHGIQKKIIARMEIKLSKKVYTICEGQESNPGQLLGGQLCSPLQSFLGENKYFLVVLRTEKLLFVYSYTQPVVAGARLSWSFLVSGFCQVLSRFLRVHHSGSDLDSSHWCPHKNSYTATLLPLQLEETQ